MRQFIFFLLFFTLGPVALGRMVLFGGGPYDEAGVNRFVDWAGNKTARILVCHWASEEPPGPETSGGAAARFKKLGARSVDICPEVKELEKSAAVRAAFEAKLKRSTGIFFTGGSQTQVIEFLQKYPDLLREIRAIGKSPGRVYGGTSAGTALAGKQMIFERAPGTGVEVSEGLGLTDKAVFDTHFIVRKRQKRLEQFLATPRAPVLGIGVDQGASLSLEGDQIRVLEGRIMVYARDSGGKIQGPLALDIGNSFSLDSPQSVWEQSKDSTSCHGCTGIATGKSTSAHQ